MYTITLYTQDGCTVFAKEKNREKGEESRELRTMPPLRVSIIVMCFGSSPENPCRCTHKMPQQPPRLAPNETTTTTMYNDTFIHFISWSVYILDGICWCFQKGVQTRYSESMYKQILHTIPAYIVYTHNNSYIRV